MHHGRNARRRCELAGRHATSLLPTTMRTLSRGARGTSGPRCSRRDMKRDVAPACSCYPFSRKLYSYLSRVAQVVALTGDEPATSFPSKLKIEEREIYGHLVQHGYAIASGVLRQTLEACSGLACTSSQASLLDPALKQSMPIVMRSLPSCVSVFIAQQQRHHSVHQGVTHARAGVL